MTAGSGAVGEVPNMGKEYRVAGGGNLNMWRRVSHNDCVKLFYKNVYLEKSGRWFI